MIQDEYATLSIFRRKTSLDRLPRETKPSPICADLDMINRSCIYNYTKPKGAAADEADRFSGTLSATALQTILEYTTRPGDVVVTFNAQFGAIYEAAENCGRLVFGSECFQHFGNEARSVVQGLVGEVPPPVQRKAKTRTTIEKVANPKPPGQ